MLQVDDQPWIAEHAGITSLEPEVKPANRLITPFVQGSIVTAIREIMIPRTDPRLERRVHFLEHSWNAVAVSVLEATDEEGWNLQLVNRMQRRAPEAIIVLMPKVIERPRR